MVRITTRTSYLKAHFFVGVSSPDSTSHAAAVWCGVSADNTEVGFTLGLGGCSVAEAERLVLFLAVRAREGWIQSGTHTVLALSVVCRNIVELEEYPTNLDTDALHSNC